ncbi:MAG: 50S ribosomal protein L21 [Prevotellaceae bacterium]|jgi:large subunit ribosomal protein L21|nr:50S ribosomal protein L21 [Prevotellaceae bacterium]
MYAIVEILGQQFKVEAGKRLFVHRMNEAERGSSVEFERVLLLDNDGAVKVGVPTVQGAKVVAEVLSHVRGDKVLVFHKKRRKGHRKLNGHRQDFTELLIKEIVAKPFKILVKCHKRKA